MKLKTVVFVLCVVAIMREPALCSDVPSVEEIEKKAITYRLENIKQGQVHLHVLDEHPSTECLFNITFDEHRVRQIRRYKERGKPDWSKPEKIIVTPKQYIADHEDTTIPVAVEIAPAKDYKSPREHFGILNLQALGMGPNGAAQLSHAQVDSWLNRSDRTSPEIHADVREGLHTWRIDYEIKNEGGDVRPKVSLWIAPSQGFSVVGIQLLSEQDGHRYASIVDSQLKQYPKNNVWYQSKLIKMLKEDNRVVNRQEVIVEEARFGEPIDESAFTPAGLDLKPGREIVDSISGQPWLKVWDGKELANPSHVRTAPAKPANPVRHRLPRWLLLTLSAILGLISIIYFWRVIRKRRSTASPGS